MKFQRSPADFELVLYFCLAKRAGEGPQHWKVELRVEKRWGWRKGPRNENVSLRAGGDRDDKPSSLILAASPLYIRSYNRLKITFNFHNVKPMLPIKNGNGPQNLPQMLYPPRVKLTWALLGWGISGRLSASKNAKAA